MKITSIEQFKELCSLPDGLDCHISDGLFSSSKHCTYDEKYGYNVLHLIDDTETLSKDEVALASDTNIVDAIKAGCLFTD